MNVSKIKVDETLAINADELEGRPVLTRDQVWSGLMLKVYDATPFVPLMTKCDVISELENGIIRNIVFDGMELKERIIFYPKKKVEFIRIGFGAEMGTIWNEIIGNDPMELKLRFSFELEINDLSLMAEKDYRDKRAVGYLKAVKATISQIQNMAMIGKV
tara:strand:+ start:478 stop:957 length:480 start_codon:yes stop_codon:yes gene_type:complete